ncbi:BQ5605_C010g06142 [Microbotryum silenes-dioicae]|uniref:BQ5605_C010g06142 protein n=1 Tax=Microbotryum silenes-dioicae TaxID=796604 RepID=A0A2X0MBT7_9BASI|nr:BQ5605_C010g06142 [Microbotryum silenes-dioicae]
MDQFLDLDAINAAMGVGAISIVGSNGGSGAGGADGAGGATSTSHLVGAFDDQFNDMFQQYLAPELTKSAPMAATPIASTSELPFAAASADAMSFSNDTLDPRTYLPTLPGSPIGAFSPSSDNSGARINSLSPLSFPDLDGPGDSSAWTLDPAIFGGDPVPDMMTSQEAPASLFGDLPALPDLQVEASPESIKAESVTASSITITPHPSSTRASRASAQQAKRQLSEALRDEEEEEQEQEDDEEDEDDAEDDDEDMDSDHYSAPRSTRATKKARTISSNSKARSGSKAPRSVAVFATKELHHTNTRSNLPPVPEWTDKPDPDTYKKLSSKEKRQLRNKISARNFRHRRKEQLTTLEDEISSRDNIISQLQEEVGTMRTENSTLRSEVSMLKAKWDEMMEKMTAFQAPQSATAVSTATTGLGVRPRLVIASSTAASSPSDKTTDDDLWALDSPQSAPSPLPTVASGSRRGTRASNGITKPNLSKDVAPNMGGRRSTGSWATQGFGGGFTSVHTTLLPDPAALLNAKSSLANYPQQNFNPALNNISASSLAQCTQHLREGSLASGQQQAPAPRSTFEDFFASNPYWLRPDQVEEYRGQLYGKIANNTAGLIAAQKLGSSQLTSGSHLSMPNGFRPAFFTSSPSSARFAAPSMNGGKEPRDVGPSSDLLEFQSPRAALAQQQATALVATLATQTLFSKMTSAFVDAFTGSDGGKTMDANKVADVLAGRSKVQLVPQQSQQAAVSTPSIESLGLSLSSLDLSNDARSPSPRPHCSFNSMTKKWCS